MIKITSLVLKTLSFIYKIYKDGDKTNIHTKCQGMQNGPYKFGN